MSYRRGGRAAEIENELAAQGLPAGTSLADLVAHHRGNAKLAGVLEGMAAQMTSLKGEGRPTAPNGRVTNAAEFAANWNRMSIADRELAVESILEASDATARIGQINPGDGVSVENGNANNNAPARIRIDSDLYRIDGGIIYIHPATLRRLVRAAVFDGVPVPVIHTHGGQDIEEHAASFNQGWNAAAAAYETIPGVGDDEEDPAPFPTFIYNTPGRDARIILIAPPGLDAPATIDMSDGKSLPRFRREDRA